MIDQSMLQAPFIVYVYEVGL